MRSNVAFYIAFVLALLTCARSGVFAQANKSASSTKHIIDGPASSPGTGWQADQALLAGLRTRGLFTVATTYCRARLSEANLDPRTKAELTLELSRTLAAHAVQSPPEARDPLWTAASAAIDEFLRQAADHPRAFIVRLQAAQVAQGRGELALREAELLPGDATLRPSAQKYLREAIASLTVLRDDIASALRKQPTNQALPAGDDSLTSDELVSLERNVRYQIAKAQQDIAATYPAGNDRVDALAQADKLLEPLAAANSEDEVVWQARVDRIAVDRKLGRTEQAQQRIEQLAAKARPGWVEARLHIERALLASLAGKHDAALAALDAPEITAGGTSSAELDDQRLDLVLAAWNAAHKAGDERTAAARQSAAAELVRKITAQHGPYWSRRAKLRAAATIASAGANDATLLASAAENFLHTGRPGEALRSYDQAAAAARATGDEDQAFRFALTAAAVEQQQKHLKEALTRYAELARSAPKHPEAAKAHLQATWNAAHVSGPQSSEYRALLDEHLKAWSESPTADDARLWLARVLQSQRKWREAAETFRSVRPESKNFASALTAAIACYDQALAAVGTSQPQARDRLTLANDAAAWCESLIHKNDADWPAALSPCRQQAALAAVRWRVRYAGASARDAAQFLAKAIAHSPDAPAEWLTRAKLLEIEVAAASGEFDRADRLLAAMEAAAANDKPKRPTPASVRELLDALATQRNSRSEDAVAAKRLAALGLATGKLPTTSAASDNEQTPPDTPAARRAQAAALAAAGRRDEALAAYRKLAAESPNDASVQRGYAQFLSGGTDRASAAAALAQWRVVESKTRADTAEWFAAKYEVAALHERLGDKQQALRVITLLAALYPDLGGTESKAKFEALRKRVQN